MKKNISRRKALKTIGLAGFAAPTIMNYNLPITERTIELSPSNKNLQDLKFSKPLTCIIIGGGNRGWVYSSFAAKRPELMKVIGVAEPIKIRRDKFKSQHDIDEDKLFNYNMG